MWKKLLITIAVFLVLFLAAVFTLAIVYEDQVKKIIIGQINKQLIAPVKVGTIEFSLLKNFPNASLSFYDVKAQSVYHGSDAGHCPKDLLGADEISLQFNLKDIFNGNYTIHKLAFRGIQLHIFYDHENLDNYHCWKVDSSKSTAAVRFKLDQIVVQNFACHYNNRNQELVMNLLFKDAQLKGEIFNEDFAMLLTSDLKIETLSYDGTHFLEGKQVALDIGLLRTKGRFSFKNAHVQLERMKFDLTGNFTSKELAFEAKGQELDIQSFISLLPQKFRTKFADYNSTGLFALNFTLKGTPGDLQLRAGFTIEGAKLGKKGSNVSLHDIYLKGYYNNGRLHNLHTSGVYVNSCNARINNSPIEGKFSLVDFNTPFIDAEIKATFKLEEVKELLQLDTFKILKGNAILALQLACPLEQLKSSKLLEEGAGAVKGTFELHKASFGFINDATVFESLEADLYADEQVIVVKQLDFVYGKTDIQLQGELSNYQALLQGNQQQKSVLKAYMNSNNFELEDWLPEPHQKKNESSKNSDFYLNTVDLKLITKINRFKFDQFIAHHLSSKVYFKEMRFNFDSLRFECMDGKTNASGAIEIDNSGAFELICDAHLSKLNISKLFLQLNNFGQKTLTDKHIAGKLSADIKYKSSWTNINHIIPESILADAQIQVSDGELNNFTPLNKLSKFVSLNELSHIRFKELSNTISISNKKIYIPEFQIKSSALNLYCSGTHDFENAIDYHFKVTLDELLSKKRKREAPKNKEFDEVEVDDEGKTTLFISMTGTVDHPVIKFDKKELKQFVKDEIKSEKQTVKQLLKEEFGLFKKDKSLENKKAGDAIKEPDFEVEWEEEPSRKESKSTAPVTSPAKKEKKIFGGQQKEEKQKAKKQQEENSDDFL